MVSMVGTTQVYIRKNGQTLLLKRRAKRKDDEMAGKLVAVGGRLELGETPRECAIREAKEETGLELHDVIFRGVVSYVEKGRDIGLASSCHAFIFETDNFSGKSMAVCNEGELFWVDDNDIFNQNILAHDRIFLPWIYQDKRIFLGEFLVDEWGKESYQVVFC